METANLNAGLILKQLRKKLGITQRELAEKINVSNRTVSAWENNTRQMKLDKMLKILESCDMSLYELFTDRDFPMNNFRLYICKMCGNIIIAHREADVSCCGMLLKPESMEHFGKFPEYDVQRRDGYIKFTIYHDSHIRHYIKFISYITGKGSSYTTLSYSSPPVLYAPDYGEGELLVYCTRHGLCHAHYLGKEDSEK